MSKRLEEVKHFVDLINFIPRDSRGMGEMDVVNVQEDMQWLIERVQELESEIENWQKGRFLAVSTFAKEIDLKKRVQELEQQNQHYREVLEFYAEGKHVAYKLDETDDDLVVDYGEKARKALEGEE